MEGLRNLLFSQPHGRNEIYYNLTQEELRFLEDSVRDRGFYEPMYAVVLDEDVEKQINDVALRLEGETNLENSNKKASNYALDYVARKYLAGILAEVGNFYSEKSQPLLENFWKSNALEFFESDLEMHCLNEIMRKCKPTFCIFQHKKTPAVLQKQINNIINGQGYPVTIKYLTAEDRLSTYKKSGGGIIEPVHDYSDQSIILNLLKEQQEK